MRVLHDTTMLLVLIAAALLLQLVPWPGGLGAFKPWFLGLVVAYYVLEVPGKIGLGTAFLLGIVADCVMGAQLFGEHALRLLVMTYILLRFRYRLRFFPLWQQTAAIAVLLANDRVLAVWVHWMADSAMPHWLTFLSPMLGAMVWPPFFVLLDRLRYLAKVRKAV
jgi:rod shape-determining protein MreD